MRKYDSPTFKYFIHLQLAHGVRRNINTSSDVWRRKLMSSHVALCLWVERGLAPRKCPICLDFRFIPKNKIWITQASADTKLHQ